MIVFTAGVEHRIAGRVVWEGAPAAPRPRRQQLVHELVGVSVGMGAHGGGPLQPDRHCWSQQTYELGHAKHVALDFEIHRGLVVRQPQTPSVLEYVLLFQCHFLQYLATLAITCRVD